MTDDTKTIPPRRKWIKPALYLLLAGAAVFAGYQAMRAIAGGGPVRNAPDLDPGALSAQPESSTQSAGLSTSMPTAALSHGLQPMDGDPLGIAPPEGSVGRGAIQRQTAGLSQQQRRYDFPGDAYTAGEHYKRAMAARGFALVRQDAQSDSRTLLFAKHGCTVNVALHRRASKERMTTIVVTVTYLSSPPGAPSRTESGKNGK